MSLCLKEGINCIFWNYLPKTSLVIEGVYIKKKGVFLYDFYSMKFDKTSGVSYGYKLYCHQVTVTVMFKKVTKHIAFVKQLLARKEM
ncbi:hypothetical protein Y136_03235 [Listeria monocytogenes]|nr:hypothetical protein [Listeria monocytogenes]